MTSHPTGTQPKLYSSPSTGWQKRPTWLSAAASWNDTDPMPLYQPLKDRLIILESVWQLRPKVNGPLTTGDERQWRQCIQNDITIACTTDVGGDGTRRQEGICGSENSALKPYHGIHNKCGWCRHIGIGWTHAAVETEHPNHVMAYTRSVGGFVTLAWGGHVWQ